MTLPTNAGEPGNAASTGAETPRTDDDGRQLRTLEASTAAAAAGMAGAALVVATGGAAAAAFAAAAGAAAVTGAGVGAARTATYAAEDADHNVQAQSGQLVLAVTFGDAQARKAAEAALRRAGASSVQLVTRGGTWQ